MTMQLPPLPAPTVSFGKHGWAYGGANMQAYAELACKARDALIADLVKALHTASWALREPIDGWKGEVSRKALDEIRAVLERAPK